MTHIQKAMQTVGDRGRYQLILLFIFIVIYTELSLILLGSSFIYMNPVFDCGDGMDVTEDEACSRACPIVNDYTATYYAGLYCDKQTERSFVQSTVYIGSILGLLLITPFADTIGKKKLFGLSQVLVILGILMNMTGIYSKISAVMIIGQIMIGSGCYTVLIVGYVIISELSEDKFKQYSITILNLVWALAEVLIAAFYFWFNYWSNFIIFIVLIPNIAVCIATFFFLVESPYFLLQKKRDVNATLASLKMIARINKVQVSEQQLGKLEDQLNLAIKEYEQSDSQQSTKASSEGASRFAIFKDKRHLRLLLTVAILQFGCNAYYYGVQFSLGQIGTNFGNNIFLTGVIQTSGYFIANAFITKLPRRKGLLLFNFICIGFGLLFFADFGSILQTALLGSCRLFNTFALALIPMMQNEPFPHKYRSVAWGYIQGFSQFGNFITPYIVTGCQNAGINPLIIFSFMLCVIGTFPLFFYPETLNVSEDALVKMEAEEDLQESMLSQSGDSSEGIIKQRQ